MKIFFQCTILCSIPFFYCTTVTVYGFVWHISLTLMLTRNTNDDVDLTIQMVFVMYHFRILSFLLSYKTLKSIFCLTALLFDLFVGFPKSKRYRHHQYSSLSSTIKIVHYFIHTSKHHHFRFTHTPALVLIYLFQRLFFFLSLFCSVLTK